MFIWKYAEVCGPQCEEVTNCKNVTACRALWSLRYHSAQKELVSFIISTIQQFCLSLCLTLGFQILQFLLAQLHTGHREAWEWADCSNGKACLTCADFWTLGLNRDMESTVRHWLFYTWYKNYLYVLLQLFPQFYYMVCLNTWFWLACRCWMASCASNDFNALCQVALCLHIVHFKLFNYI